MLINGCGNKMQVLNSVINASEIVKNIIDTGLQEDAFYVCDIGDIVKKFRKWRKVLPRVQPFYAVKCNDNVEVLKVLSALGTGFDCASKNEISKILELGVKPERIIYANPAKAPNHIKFSAANNVHTMTFDSEHELYKIKKLSPNAKMVLRIRSDASVDKCNMGLKFGCDAEKETPALLKLARDLNIDIVGVSFHVGSYCYQPEVYSTAIQKARRVYDLAVRKFGFNFTLLDIGGGYPGGKYASIKGFAAEINWALEKYFPESQTGTVKIIAEPGHYFVASAYTLACNIHSIRDIKSDDGRIKHRMYYVNDGTYGSFNVMAFYGLQDINPIPVKTGSLDWKDSKNMVLSSFWGPTCDGLDILVKEILYPVMGTGDWVMFEDMGAYTLPLCSQFNGFSKPEVHVVADCNVWRRLKNVAPLTQDDFVLEDVDKTQTRVR